MAGWEGERGEIARRRVAAARGAALGRARCRSGAARARRGSAARFAGPHLRDALLDRGVLVETLETAATWSALAALHGAVRGALQQALRGDAAGRRLPRVAPLSRRRVALLHRARAPGPGRPGRSVAAAKRAAGDAIAAAGATITHHHAIGRDHVAWLEAEHGALGVELLRAVKQRCDPEGVMNPGKLLPA